MKDIKKIYILIGSLINGIAIGIAWHWGLESFVIGILAMVLINCQLILMEITK